MAQRNTAVRAGGSGTKPPGRQKATGKTRRVQRPAGRVVGATVKLELKVFDPQDADDVKTVLDGRIPAGRRKPFPTLADRTTAARRVSRGIRKAPLATLLAALAHPQRLTVLLKLLGGEATHQLLTKATGLKAGPLHHHLRELRVAGLIGPKVRDLYMLTRRGRRAILTAIVMGRVCR